MLPRRVTTSRILFQPLQSRILRMTKHRHAPPPRGLLRHRRSARRGPVARRGTTATKLRMEKLLLQSSTSVKSGCISARCKTRLRFGTPSSTRSPIDPTTRKVHSHHFSRRCLGNDNEALVPWAAMLAANDT